MTMGLLEQVGQLDQRIRERDELLKLVEILLEQKDPVSVLLKMSRMCLQLLRRSYEAVGQSPPSDNLFDCIETATKQGWLPSEIASSLHYLRTWSNKADHAAEKVNLNIRDGENALNVFLQVLEWFYCEFPYGPRIPSLVGDSGKRSEVTFISHFTHIPKPSKFLDREGELRRLNEWLKDEEQNIGALIGVSGQGKTYLAAKFAEECQQNGWQVRWVNFPFTVEQFLLSIASEMQKFNDPYASIVGDPQQPYEVRIDNAIRFLESQQQPWLIVLDDFHKATEDEWQKVIALFDRYCHKTKILLTARREPEAFEEVKLPTGAHEVLDVPKLPKEVAKDYLQALGLSVDEERAERIWEKCSGNPVAMKLFAQAARRRSVEKLLQMPLPEWSENAQKWMDELLGDLSELAKEAAKRLSIFDKPIEHDLLLAIGSTEDGLFELQDYRLAERTIDERWQEHDLLRQYWKAKLSEEEKASWHRLAGEWLKGQAEKIEAEQGERKFEEWSLELQQTWANYLRRAFWQFASAKAINEAFEVASHIAELFARWGEWDENLRLCQKALELARKSEDETAIAFWAHQLAIRHHARGNYEEAEKLYRESLEINERLGNLQGKAATLHQLGMLAHDRENYEEAERLYRESLEINERLGNLQGKAATLHELGSLAYARGNYEEAKRLYRESLEICERLEYLEGKAGALWRLGLLRKDQGRKDEAKDLLKQALEIFERMGHRYAKDVRKDLEALEKEEGSTESN